jgi:hypothetical protein
MAGEGNGIPGPWIEYRPEEYFVIITVVTPPYRTNSPKGISPHTLSSRSHIYVVISCRGTVCIVQGEKYGIQTTDNAVIILKDGTF